MEQNDKENWCCCLCKTYIKHTFRRIWPENCVFFSLHWFSLDAFFWIFILLHCFGNFIFSNVSYLCSSSSDHRPEILVLPCIYASLRSQKGEDCKRVETAELNIKHKESLNVSVHERVWERHTQKDSVTCIYIWTQRPQQKARKRNDKSCMNVHSLLHYGIKKAIKSAKVRMCANQMLNMLLLQFHFYGWVNTLIEVVSRRDINLVNVLHKGASM